MTAPVFEYVSPTGMTRRCSSTGGEWNGKASLSTSGPGMRRERVFCERNMGAGTGVAVGRGGTTLWSYGHGGSTESEGGENGSFLDEVEAAKMEERRKIDQSETLMDDPYGPVDAVMTKPVVTVRPEDTLESVLPHFAHFTGMPVVDEQGRCIGIISNIDVAKRVRAKKFSVKDTTVREVMTSPAYVIMEKAPVAYAAGLMLQHKIHRLPVVNAEGNVLGIITRNDIFEPLSPSWNSVYHGVLGDHSHSRSKRISAPLL